MSYSTKNLSSSKLLQKASKSNLLSSKSVTTYVKELDEEAKLINLKKSQEQNEDNSSDLKNILNALKNSKKKLLNSKNVSPSDEICDFKNIGDLSSISFAPNNSFLEVSSEEETESKVVIDNSEEDENNYIPLDLEREEESDVDDVCNNLNNLSIELILNKIQLEKERVNMSQTQFRKLKDEYLQNLSLIREDAYKQLTQLRLEEMCYQKNEQRRLEEREKANQEEALKIEEQYMIEVELKKNEILKEVEALTAAEEKRKVQDVAVLEKLQEGLSSLEKKLCAIQMEAKELGCDGELMKIVFEKLPSIYEVTKNDLNKLIKLSSKDEGIAAISRRLDEGMKILDNIQRLLDAQKEQKLSRQVSEESHVEETASLSQPSTGHSFPPPEYQNKTSNDFLKNDETVHGDMKILSSQLSVSQETNPILIESENFYQLLKAKFNSIAEAADKIRENKENPELRALLSRAVGIINTLSNEKYDSSNKGKLQQLLNLLNGRPCTIGSDSLSTANDASAQAFVKEQLAIRIISLGHDKQVATMGIYVSLIVRLWQLYPEVGELILFRLYETCPFLVPLPVRRDPSQTDEEFNRSIGIRHKDGGTQEPLDKYLTRMGAAAQLYGRLTSIQVENHPHGIQEGWKWIAKTLSMPPQPSITAALLSGFLSTAGSPLLSNYGKQFRKLLQFICTTYLPLIEKEVLEGGYSDIVSLKTLLEQYQLTNSLPQVPEGYKLLL